MVHANNDILEVELLTANNNDELLIEQALKHKPNMVVIGDKAKYAVGDSLYGSIDFKSIETDDRNVKIEHLGVGNFRAKVTKEKVWDFK